MADYGSDGLWMKDGVGTGPDELPVSVALKERLRKWCDWYEDSTDYLPRRHPDFNAAFDNVAFATEGLEIAQAVKAELPDWTIIYFDTAKLEEVRPWKLGEPRGHFEYEVIP